MVYSSSVREKPVSEAETEPSAAGVGGLSAEAGNVEVRFARSRFSDVDCLRAELNCVFCVCVRAV